MNLGKRGRKITESGRDDLRTSFIYARSDYIMTRILRVITDANFDVNKQRGEVSVTISLIREDQEQRVREILKEMCQTKLFPQLMKIAQSGDKLCGREVPEGVIGLAVPAGIVLEQNILKNGIYLNPLYCCLIEFKDQKPVKCNNFSTMTDVSYDPMEMWINHKVGSVYNTATKNHGAVFGGYTEIPYTARTKVIGLAKKIVDIFGGLIMIGGSEDNVLGISTQPGYTGVISICAESLPAALEECEIQTNTRTVEAAINFKELEPIAPVKGEVLLL